MDQPMKNVIIVGASGNLGPAVLDAFLQTPSFNISILSRAESSAVFPTGVKIHKTDYTKSSLITAFKGQDAVVSIVPYRALAEQTKLIDAAIAAGVRRFLPSEWGSSPGNTRNRDIMPSTFSVKGDILEYLRHKESTGLSWTAIATGAFFDWCLKVGFLGFDLNKHEGTVWDDGECPFATTNINTIGLAVVKVLQTPEVTANKILHIASFTVTLNDTLNALEEATGTKWKVEKTTSDEQIAAGQQKLRNNDFAGAVPHLVRATWYTKGRGANFAEDVGLDNDLLGLPKEDLLSVVKDIVKSQN